MAISFLVRGGQRGCPAPNPGPQRPYHSLKAPYDARAGAAWALLIANIGDEEINPIGHDRVWTLVWTVDKSWGGGCSCPLVLVQRRVRGDAPPPPRWTHRKCSLLDITTPMMQGQAPHGRFSA